MGSRVWVGWLVWAEVSGLERERGQQILFGDDTQKGKSNGNSRSLTG
jgi:hypothetical protein